MLNKYLTAFIVGSSLPVFALFFYGVAGYKQNNIINYSYERYTLLAPLYFGVMTMIALYISNIMNISLQISLFIVSILSIIIISTLITSINAYKFSTQKQWYNQYITISIAHLITYNIIIYLIITPLKL